MKKNCVLKHCWCNDQNFMLCDHNIKESNDLESIAEELQKLSSEIIIVDFENHSYTIPELKQVLKTRLDTLRSR